MTEIVSFSFVWVDGVACLDVQKDELIDMEVDERTWAFAPVKEGDVVMLPDISYICVLYICLISYFI